MTEIIQTADISADLAAALVAAQAEAESLTRDGDGQHGAYTSSDEIAHVARGLLTRHGLAWVRVGVELLEPVLASCELGNQSYVGDLVERWALVHKSGAALVTEGSRMPVIASKGRPHDKAVGASLTYDAGAVLRGLLCLDREDRNTAVDRRADGDVHSRKPKSDADVLRETIAERVDTIAAVHGIERSHAWIDVCARAGFPKPLGGGRGPFGVERFEDLRKINDVLKAELAETKAEVAP